MSETQCHHLYVLAIVLAGLFGSFTNAGDCPPRYEVTAIIEGPDCGEPWGKANVTVWGMNDHGDVAGWFSCTVGYDHAFVWYNEGEGSGTFVEIPMPPKTYYCRAYDINNDGYVTGEAIIADSGYQGSVGFLYDGQDTEVIVPPAPYLGLRARALNAQLDIVGELGPPDTAFLYRNGVVHDLGPLLTGEASEAYGCNDAGLVVGWAGWLGSPYFLEHAFLTDGHTVTEFGPMPGGLTSRAQAVDDKGRWAGFAIVQDGPDEYSSHALYWDGVNMIDLGTLPGRDKCKAWDLCNETVVGYTMTGGQAGEAFLWEDGVMWDLNDLVDTGDVLLSSARAIDSLGQVVCQGHQTGLGFVLSPLDYLCGDADEDGVVDVLDLLLVLRHWGPGESCADLNLDGIVDADDLSLVLDHWGQTQTGRAPGR